MPLTPPPPITGTILSMAHASGNKWVDEVSGVKWKYGTNAFPFTELGKPKITIDDNPRVTDRPYLHLAISTRVYTDNIGSIDSSEEFTIAVRFKYTNTTGDFYIFSTSLLSSIPGIQGLYLPSRGVISSYNTGASNSFNFASIKLEQNTWYHIAFTRKYGKFYMFIDGIVKDWTNASGFVPIPNHAICTSPANDPYDAIKSYDEILVIKGQALWPQTEPSAINVKFFEPNDLDFGYIVKPYKEIEDPTIKIY